MGVLLLPVEIVYITPLCLLQLSGHLCMFADFSTAWFLYMILC